MGRNRICQDCHLDLESSVEADAVGPLIGVEPLAESTPCDLCAKELGRGTCYSITWMECRDDFARRIQSEIYRCDGHGCGKVYNEGMVVFDETNTTVEDVFSEIVDGLKKKDTYARLLRLLRREGHLGEVELPDIVCRGCGNDIEGWDQEVKVKVYRRLLPKIPVLPDEIASIPSEASNPSDVIEYFRSDCSNSLVHLTKDAELKYRVDSIEEREDARLFKAKEILYLILASKKLLAAQGMGLHAPAVCFTEKPLAGLKDTLLGMEASVRGARKSIKWQPYGLMFSKEYLQRLGASPVLHLTHDEEASIPQGMKHRVVRFSSDVNWNHEREWRCGSDIGFDPAEAIVLVPRFEQISAFQKALERVGIRVKGYLPLLDLFACI